MTNRIKPRHLAILVAMTSKEQHTTTDIEADTKIGLSTLISDLTILGISGHIDSNWKTLETCGNCGKKVLKRWLTLKGHHTIEQHCGTITDDKRTTLLNNWYTDLKGMRRIRISLIALAAITTTYLIDRYWVTIPAPVYYSIFGSITGIYIGRWWRIGRRLKPTPTN